MSNRDRPDPAADPLGARDAPEDMILEIDPEGVVRSTSRPTWVGDGVPRTGKPLTASLALEGASILAVLERTRRNSRSERVMGRLLHAGELMTVAGRLTPLPEASNGPGWVLALRPDHDLATRLLEATPGTLLRAVEQMSLGFTLSDGDGRIVYANRAEGEMHGYSPTELIGRHVAELGGPETADGPGPEAPGKHPWVRQRTNRRRDGGIFPVRLISDEIRDETEQLLGRATISEDISERARLERMKEDFITVVGHELRTPLTSILTSLVLLRREHEHESRNEGALAVAERNARHLLELVRDLLDLQNAVSGSLEIRTESVPVAPLLREAAERLERTDARRSGVLQGRIQSDFDDVVSAPDAEPLRVLADRAHLLRVLEHLIANALKFSPATEPVRLDAVGGAERTTLTIVDRGPGIPAELRHRLFQPFAFGDASTTRPGPGPGLGLTLSKALLELMDGDLEIGGGADAESPGTVVKVHLPRG